VFYGLFIKTKLYFSKGDYFIWLGISRTGLFNPNTKSEFIFYLGPTVLPLKTLSQGRIFR
jgi:hypothetical protein